MPQIGAVSATLSDIGSAAVISPSAASSVTPYAVAQIFTPARLLRGNPPECSHGERIGSRNPRMCDEADG
jgi:hypothetical protein